MKRSLSASTLWCAIRYLSGRDLVNTLSTQIILVGLGAFTGTMAARLLGPEGRGELTALTLWPFILVTLATMGMNQSIVFHAGKNLYTPSEVWTSSAVIGLGQSLAVILIGFLILPLALRNYSPSVNHLALIFLISVPVLLFQGSSYPSSILQAKLDLPGFNLTRVLSPLGLALGLAALWWLGRKTLADVVAAQIVSYGAAAVIGYWVFLRRFSIRIAWNAGACSHLLRFGWQTQAGLVSNLVNQRFDQLLLILFIAPRQLGLYAVAVTVSSVVTFVPVAIGLVTLARGVNLAAPLAKQMIASSFRRSVGYLSVLCLALFIVAPRLINLFFGSQFSDAALSCRILLTGTVALGAAQVLYEGARAMGQPLLVFYAEGLSMLVTCLGLYFLLPRYGIVGAAVTSAVAYNCALCLMLFLCWLRLGLGLRELLGGVSGDHIEAVGSATLDGLVPGDPQPGER